MSEIEAVSADLPAGGFRQFTVVATAVTITDAGHCDKAETIVFADLLPSGHFGGALSVAVAFLHRGDTDRALRVLEATEQAARSASAEVDEQGLLRWIDVLTDFRDVDRAEPLAHSLRNPDVSDAAWARIAECLASDGDFDRFTSALSRIARLSLQRRPRMEIIRVLLARCDDDRAVALARSATAVSHRAAALALIAERTGSKDLLDEAVDLATGSDNFEEQVEILLPALRAAANMADRATVEHLLRRVTAIRELSSGQSGQTFQIARKLSYLPGRVNTLTEIVEKIERFLDPDNSGERAPVVRAAAPPLWAGSSPLPFRKQLARALAISNWLDIVDRVVDLEPNVYLAIAGELDRLHNHRYDEHPES